MGSAQVTLNMPDESFYVEGIQLAKRGIAMDIQRFLPEIATVQFVESFTKPEAVPKAKATTTKKGTKKKTTTKTKENSPKKKTEKKAKTSKPKPKATKEA